MSPSQRGGLLARAYAIPVGLGLATAIGLVAGLVGDGAWDVVSTAALAIPLVVILAGPLLTRGRRSRRRLGPPRLPFRKV